MAEVPKMKVASDSNLVTTAELLQLLHSARRRLAVAGYENEQMKNMADTIQSILALIFGAPAARLTEIQIDTIRALEKELEK